MDGPQVMQARDLLLQHMAAHRATCSEESDCGEVANILAFMAHSLGASRRDLMKFPTLLVDYDMRCAGCGSTRHDQTAKCEGK
jgi:hypothetical protein